ncbi:hypothetical protein GGI59_005538 [Rhizobium lentis]|uniref:Uncharacterized protein n=1 Tax=Rhizobium lentis TaxID=1138194 RepID=A0A7W8XJA4_9HYPH|nr:hypothetical protein [Rhizobium lentis]MBB5553901.1 hypothetical protein [Rhizobium lentis]MBB5563839.1 hypothetical protein [Rhizobium lentis]MBB5570893.1 hypothetical protein [Rhizobium lentis]
MYGRRQGVVAIVPNKEAQARHLCPSGELACEPLCRKDYPLSRIRKVRCLWPRGLAAGWKPRKLDPIPTVLKRIGHFHIPASRIR